jgi:hypothetical protein
MIVSPSPKAIKHLRLLQQHGLESNFAEHRIPDRPSELQAQKWCPPLPLKKSEQTKIFLAGFERAMSATEHLPTALEDPICYSLYREILVRIEKNCAALGFRLPARLCLGTIHSTRLNAHAYEVDHATDECLVVISRQIIPFAISLGGS